jgi:CheY-like chemotaxis protein
MKTILYIEEKPNVRENVIRMIEGVGFFKVLTAATALDAIDIVEKIEVDCVIVGRKISTKEIEVLDHHLRKHKEIKLILMAERRSKVASILKAFEYNIQFETPADVNMLLDTLLSEFEIDCGGQLRGISTASFLQMIELEAKTCVIKVTKAGKAGYLYCDSGSLIEAEMGELNGKEAVFEILNLEDVLLLIDYKVPQKDRTINAPLMSLLLESGRLKDETHPAPKENRSYKRFECELPVEFFYGDLSHEAVIRNISLSGIYLETKGPFTVGKEVEVALFSPSLDKGCRISGIIVRRDENGLGIEFLQANITKMAILRTIIHEVQAVNKDEAIN